VHIDLQNTGDAGARAETAAAIEHALADHLGQWRPKGFERSYTLVAPLASIHPKQ
jgi:hypothetical protein